MLRKGRRHLAFKASFPCRPKVKGYQFQKDSTKIHSSIACWNNRKSEIPYSFYHVLLSAPRKWFQYQLEWPSLSINSIIESLRKKESMFVFNSSSSKGIGRNRSFHIRTGSFPCLIGACRQLEIELLLRKLSLIRSEESIYLFC
nr:hypothetical protein [Solanum melongena]WMB96813.1 hypothetical protein [Solanum melongena]WMB97036.1 hypothetical protein [Solanum aethiopicum]